jgi:hypothetical protein
MMNISRHFLVLSFSLLLPTLLAGQTPDDNIAKLKARVKELEAENAKLKQDIAKKRVGVLNVPYGQIVTIEGEYDPKAGIKNVHDYRVTSVNGQKLASDVHLRLITPEWARKKGTLGKVPLKLMGFESTGTAGSQSTAPGVATTGLAFTIVNQFVVIDVIDEKQMVSGCVAAET